MYVQTRNNPGSVQLKCLTIPHPRCYKTDSQKTDVVSITDAVKQQLEFHD
jgi:hypothetical protein